MDYTQLIDNLLVLLGNYGFLLVIFFGILHPLTENPWSLVTMTLSISLLGIFFGYLVLIISNIIGILLLYFIVCSINKKSNYFFHRKKISQKVLSWINNTESWRHIVVIGLPLIPTYPVKVSLPFSNMSFKRYFFTLLGSYFFLYTANSLIYFGVMGFITNNIPNYVSFFLLLLFALYIYFGKYLRKKWSLSQLSDK